MNATDEPLRPDAREAAADEADRPRAVLPDPYRCDDPYCRNAAQGPHLHGTRPDGVRV